MIGFADVLLPRFALSNSLNDLSDRINIATQSETQKAEPIEVGLQTSIYASQLLMKRGRMVKLERVFIV